MDDKLRSEYRLSKLLRHSIHGKYAEQKRDESTREVNMETLSLQSPLADEVRQAAQREGIEASEFLADAVRHRLAVYRQKQIVAETDAWYRLPAEERRKYEGKYVAVHGGQVVDSDPDRLTLYLRLRERFGREPVLMTEGGDHPIPVYRVRSPRRA